MTNLLYFYRVVRDAYSDSSSSQGEITPQTSQRHTVETSTLYPAPGVREEDSSDAESDTGSLSSFKKFTFDELIAITGGSLRYDCLREDQDDSDKVFKGWVHKKKLTATDRGKGTAVDVILLSQGEQLQDTRGWVAEVKYLRQLSHPNLVRLFGYCLYKDHQLLVYEGMPHALESYLFKGSIHTLPWGIRMKVALGAAKGLAFLHSAQVIYRNFTTSHVHLDTNYNAKLSNFGLPKDRLTGDKSHVAPEYPTTGHLTAKSDVYSFGVLLLETLSGRQASESKERDLVEWAMPYLDGDILNVLDRSLKAQYSLANVRRVANLTLQCLATEAELRPNMDEVIRRLKEVQDSRYMKLTQREEVLRELEYSQSSQDTEATEIEQESEYLEQKSEYFQSSQDMEATEIEQESEYLEQKSEYFEDLQDIDDNRANREQEQENLILDGR